MTRFMLRPAAEIDRAASQSFLVWQLQLNSGWIRKGHPSPALQLPPSTALALDRKLDYPQSARRCVLSQRPQARRTVRMLVTSCPLSDTWRPFEEPVSTVVLELQTASVETLERGRLRRAPSDVRHRGTPRAPSTSFLFPVATEEQVGPLPNFDRARSERAKAV